MQCEQPQGSHVLWVGHADASSVHAGQQLSHQLPCSCLLLLLPRSLAAACCRAACSRRSAPLPAALSRTQHLGGRLLAAAGSSCHALLQGGLHELRAEHGCVGWLHASCLGRLLPRLLPRVLHCFVEGNGGRPAARVGAGNQPGGCPP